MISMMKPVRLLTQTGSLGSSASQLLSFQHFCVSRRSSFLLSRQSSTLPFYFRDKVLHYLSLRDKVPSNLSRQSSTLPFYFRDKVLHYLSTSRQSSILPFYFKTKFYITFLLRDRVPLTLLLRDKVPYYACLL
jgi:hypothetical protein